MHLQLQAGSLPESVLSQLNGTLGSVSLDGIANTVLTTSAHNSMAYASRPLAIHSVPLFTD